MAKKQEKIWWKEYPDPTPLEIPSELKRPESLDQRVKRILSTELSEKYSKLGAESWDEAHDFDVKDDFETDEPISKYQEMEPEFPAQASPEEQEAVPQKDLNPDVEPKADSESVPPSGTPGGMDSEPQQIPIPLESVKEYGDMSLEEKVAYHEARQQRKQYTS